MHSGKKKATVKKTVINSLEAPRLRGVAAHHFVEFKQLWELSEKQIYENDKPLREAIKPTSYKALIDIDDLEIFIEVERIEAIFIDEITEGRVQQYVEEQYKRKLEGDQSYLMEQAVRSVSMHTQIAGAMDTVWTFKKDHYNALINGWFGNLCIPKLHIAIGHILKKLGPPQL